MGIVIEWEEDDYLARLSAAEKSLHDHRIKTQAARRLYYAGKTGACTIPASEREAMRKAFYARGGFVTICPPAVAPGALVSPFWRVDRDFLVKGVREQVEAGRPVESAVSGTGLGIDEARLELEDGDDA